MRRELYCCFWAAQNGSDMHDRMADDAPKGIAADQKGEGDDTGSEESKLDFLSFEFRIAKMIGPRDDEAGDEADGPDSDLSEDR